MVKILKKGGQMKIHFIGIGGIGLSGLARYFNQKGYQISGSDLKETPLIEKLRDEGIEVEIPQRESTIDHYRPDLVVYSAVIKPSNRELRRAVELGIPILSRRQFLPYLVKGKQVISVCGAHGKSTTSAILATLLPESSAVIGAISKEFNSNCRVKPGDLLVFEADESDGSFVDSNPYIAVVTNTEPEHMEYYNYDYQLFYAHYRQFLERATYRVVNKKDSFLTSLPDLATSKVELIQATDILERLNSRGEPVTEFTYRGERFQIYGLGDHLILDALLAIETANRFQSLSRLAKLIKNYRGIKKRFDIVFDNGELVIIDDYGHHPTEIEKTLASAFKFAQMRGLKKVVAIWQPHKYSRTLDNMEGFRQCFKGVDQLVILPVWSAGEKPRKIQFRREFAHYNPVFARRIYRHPSYLKVGEETIKEGLVIGFGAGDITYQLRHTYPSPVQCSV